MSSGFSKADLKAASEQRNVTISSDEIEVLDNVPKVSLYEMRIRVSTLRYEEYFSAKAGSPIKHTGRCVAYKLSRKISQP